MAQSLALAMVLPCSGVALAHAFPETVMRRLFAGLLVATSVAMLVGR